MTPFLCINEETFDVNIKIVCKKEKEVRPQMKKSGEDLLLEYYQNEEQMMCLAKGGMGTYLSTTICDSSFWDVECTLHFMPDESMKVMGSLLRLLPIGAILQKKGVAFFHASQIAVDGKGIVFTAPSGTGKTTQAKLWKKFRDAEIICNDRTLIRNGQTYGYPVDGSEPVYSGEVHQLGAIVLLEQGKKDVVQRLSGKDTLVKLLPQLILAAWSGDARVLAIEQLIVLADRYPVYLFRCTPTESAVVCLEQQLKIDGVL